MFDDVPTLKRILLSSDPIESKRAKIEKFLSDILLGTLEDDSSPTLGWMLTRDAVGVFRNILSTRSEKLAGYSLLQYLDDLLHKETLKDTQEPGPGFFPELEHLLRGVVGKTGVYPDDIPAFSECEGLEAARLRSDNLSKMVTAARRFLDRYPCGLDNDAILPEKLGDRRHSVIQRRTT